MHASRCFIVPAIVVAAAQALCIGAQPTPYQVTVVEPAINNYAILPGHPLPKVCVSRKTIRLTACRGEYEPASFVVTTDSPLKNVKLKIGHLKGPGGALPRKAVDARVVKVILRRVTNFSGLTPWLLVHDPEMPDIENEPADTNALPPGLTYTRPNEDRDEKISVIARLRRPVKDSRKLRNVDIPQLQQFWLTVHIPHDANAGLYKTTITVAPKNASPTELDFEVTVQGFDLLPPMFEYSVYYPVNLGGKADPKSRRSFADINEQQYLAELKNMVAHGCMNPTIRGCPSLREDGTLEFSLFEKILRLRRKAGITAKRLYLLANSARIYSEELTGEQRKTIVQRTREIVAWAKKRGSEDVFFYLRDEASGEALRGERESIEAVHEGGGKTFVACGHDFFELVGDLLDVPVVVHPGHVPLDEVGFKVKGDEALLKPERLIAAGNPGKLLEPEFQAMVKGVRKNGFKIFTYMDPMAGCTLPELHRRNRGLGLWRAGLNGTMNWAYTHVDGPSKNDSANLAVSTMQSMIFSFVWRAKDGVLDTLAWEAYREGYDDARYLATLLDALREAEEKGKHDVLVFDTRAWFKSLSINADLNAWRQEMVRRIETLKK